MRLGCALPPTIALEYPTVERLTDYIAIDVFKLSESETPVEVKQPQEETENQLGDLSHDELLNLLDDELSSIDRLIGEN